ncbi:MAG: DUF262 domain-containing protein [Terriglobales bacterium]
MEFTSSVQPLSWFRDRYRDGTLKIKPPYQRKPVWAARQKCSLIESILMRLPIPEIYVQQSTSADGETKYAIVDGQQRIRAVLQFIGSDEDPKEEEHNKFALDMLPAGAEWKDLTFSELPSEKKRQFYGYHFVVRYLSTDSEAELRDMFERLNRYLTPLKPQELRNARYTGPFARLAVRLADNEYWAENRIVTPAMIRRMGDVEFASELLIGVLHGPQGGSSKIIDSYYAQYEDYEDEFPDQRKGERLFSEVLATVMKVLPEIKDTRWKNKTDFYTTFVAFNHLMRKGLAVKSASRLRKALEKFEGEIEERFADQHAIVSKQAVSYVRAVEKGANDKLRRANRHTALLDVISEFFGK